MNEAIIYFNQSIKNIEPVENLKASRKDSPNSVNKPFFTKLFRALLSKNDLTLESWQRLESKPSRSNASEPRNYFYRGGV